MMDKRRVGRASGVVPRRWPVRLLALVVVVWPLVAIHAALDRDGRVVTYGTDGGGVQTGRFVYDRWTPGPSAAHGHETLANTTATDLFCSLQLNRVDTGDLLIFGGDNWVGGSTANVGNPDINSLDPDTGLLTALPGMNRARWYATGTALPDGAIYIQGGDRGADRPERWTPGGGAELLSIDTSTLDWWYPRNFVLPDGRLFGIDVDGRMYHVSAGLDAITPAGRLPSHRWGRGATAVMYTPGKILHFGGATGTAVVIDATGDQPVVMPAASLSSARIWANGTLLPDGRVLATGGSATGDATASPEPIGTYRVTNAAEVWDPRTGRWTVQTSGAVPRLYHSTALLLPDGRVLVAGGGAPGPVTNTDAELFSPDYLVAPGGGPTSRPSIVAVSSTDLVPGETLTIDVAGAEIDRVTLLKAGSVTHSFNMEQRLVELPVSVVGGSVTTTLPLNEAVVTPGYYLLSVLDPRGIPSRSEMVRVAAPAPDRAVAGVDGQIIRLYLGYFGRRPDDAGYRHWRRALLSGVGLIEISDRFAASSEYLDRYAGSTDAEYLDRVYLNVLGREADPEGRDYWLDQLASGVARSRVTLAITESPELIAISGTPPPGDGPGGGAAPVPEPPDEGDPGSTGDQDLVAQILRLYLAYFGRPPDEAGLAYWTDQRRKGASLSTVSASFAGSDELTARYGGTSDAGFVGLVYANVLDRAPDAGGQAYWIAQLAAGLSRGDLMLYFSESPEFAIRTRPLA
jgi:hypothetical protein